jgi:hypothetical protein
MNLGRDVGRDYNVDTLHKKSIAHRALEGLIN